MGLNLDRLNSLAYSDLQQTPAEKHPARTPPEETLGGWEYKSSQNQTEAPEEQIEGIGALQRRAEQLQADKDRAIEAYKTYQENIRQSGQLQTEILKGIQAGEDIYSLFLKAAKAISCMTSNKTFYTQITADIRCIYGIGLQEPAPIMLELQQVQERLKKLQEARGDPDEQRRIDHAIRLHRAEIGRLKSALKSEKADKYIN